jgi:hypothetical protein
MLTSQPQCEITPVYSPNMNSIAYLNFEDEGYYSLWAMNPDGSNKKPLTTDTRGDRAYSFHPEDHSLLFAGFRVVSDLTSSSFEPTITSDVFLMHPSGDMRQITASEANDIYPVWSPDGETILFESGRDGGFDLYTLPRTPPVMDVVLKEMEFEGQADPGEVFRLDVEMDYELEEESHVWVIVWDTTNDKIIVSETRRIEGTGEETLTLGLTAPKQPGSWDLRVEIWFQVGSEWSHSSDKWYHNFSVYVISEFPNVPVLVLLAVSVTLTTFLSRRSITS